MPPLRVDLPAADEEAAVSGTRPREDALVLEMQAFNASQAPMTEQVFATSDRSGYHPVAAPKVVSEASALTLDPARPESNPGVFDIPRQVVRMGRPVGLDSEQRRRELLRLLAAGESFKQACKHARVSGDTLAALMDEDGFWTVAKAFRDARTTSEVIAA